ncbi:hypothetical protein ADU90_12805 [Clostridium botulinum]|uniref:Uncharacterized protein n=1 Tax=Clostridium botulinum C/D str. DC5 TaxID=1443128 RepID=A0A0A0HYP7_CLOBO|nr:hypothetical protein [Clostridium botulinum]KEI00123.1 hypothetical protein Z952_14160 [Clostridium botulinum C/D str. BKT75002]KEI06003.1 hypothetical protein Z954_14270 [Clostridium botulinum C/D str. BKT2873]KGM93181.1 hypothetical protein Z955_15780 [Clostridium botulinum C/D str. DC5]KOC50143.1 hypothetical protein ADU88_03760 [Clostridium botulinum]KOC54087.1 hypothetical protein ADU90_12805 [Clostridium botulinum]
MFNPLTFTFDETLYTNLHLKEYFIAFICLQLISICIFYLKKIHEKNKFVKMISKVLNIVSNIIAIIFFIQAGFYTKSLFLRLTGLAMVLFMAIIGKKVNYNKKN